MPTYAYACADCGHQFDIVQSFSDDALTVCPECEGRLRKQFSAVGVVFKGSGFYRTDSRSSGSGKSGASSTPAKKAESTGSSGAASSGDSGSSSTSTASTGSSSTGSSSKVSASSTAS